MFKWLKTLFSSKEPASNVKRVTLYDLDHSEKIEDLYLGLAEIWENLDLTLITKTDIRYLTNISITVNHECIETLIENLETINRLLKVKDFEELHRLSTLIHKRQHNHTLEFYLSDKGGYPLNIQEALKNLKNALIQQKQLLLQLDNLNRLWALSVVYDDLLIVTKSIVKNMLEINSGIDK